MTRGPEMHEDDDNDIDIEVKHVDVRVPPASAAAAPASGASSSHLVLQLLPWMYGNEDIDHLQTRGSSCISSL